jgi:hypothetical protein
MCLPCDCPIWQEEMERVDPVRLVIPTSQNFDEIAVGWQPLKLTVRQGLVRRRSPLFRTAPLYVQGDLNRLIG